jgi:hypothetical protein
LVGVQYCAKSTPAHELFRIETPNFDRVTMNAWRSILLGDKSPLIIATALTIFGWYVNSISTYFGSQTIISISATTGASSDSYTVKNISVNKSADKLVFQITCKSGTDCLAPRGSATNFGSIEQIAPFAALDNAVCFQSAGSFQAEVSLPPAAQVRLVVNKRANTQTEIFLVGQASAAGCTTVSLAQVRIEQEPSTIAFLLQNFVTYFFGSIIVLVVVFLVTLWRLVFAAEPDAGSGEQKQGDKDETKFMVLDVTIRRDHSLQRNESG